MASWARLVAMDGERLLGDEGRWEPRKRHEVGQGAAVLAERAW